MWDNEADDSEGLETLWKQVRAIYVEAERCRNHEKDENSWVRVVWNVLQMAGLHDIEGMFEVISV